MNMTPFDTFVRIASVQLDMFDMEDVSILKCVSKDVKTYLESTYQHAEKYNRLLSNTFVKLGCPQKYKEAHESIFFEYKSTNSETEEYTNKKVLNELLYIQHVLRVNRLYSKASENKNAFVVYLKDFTLSHVGNLFTGFKNLTMEQQKQTIRELLIYSKSKYIEVRIMTGFCVYYFICKILKQNGTSFLRNKKQCIFAEPLIKTTVISMSVQLSDVMKEEITCYPYTFTDKYIRLLNETKRLISTI